MGLTLAGALRRPFAWFALAVAVFVAAPLFVVIPMSFSDARSLEFPPPGYGLGYYKAFFADGRWTGPTLNSFLIAAGTTLLTMVLVVPASFAMVRHRFPGRGFANFLLILPLTIPHIVIALGYTMYFSQLKLIHSYPAVILAHSALCVPIAFLIVAASLKGFDRNLERAAMSLGASPLRTFFTVTLPVLRPGFIVAALFVFVHSFDETVVALFISGREAGTLPRKMFDAMRTQADPVIAVVSTLLFVAVLAGVLVPILWRWTRARRSQAA